MEQEQYIKNLFSELAKLKMSVVYIGNDAIGSANASQTIYAIGTPDRPTFTFQSLCTRDRISELSHRLTTFADTELEFDTHANNNEVKSIGIKSKKGKIKSVFTCMKESVIYGREKTLEDMAAGMTAAPRERPPKKLNVVEQFTFEMLTEEEYDDIKEMAKMLQSKLVNVSFENELKFEFVSERGEKGNIVIDKTVEALGSTKIFCYKYHVEDLLTLLKLYPTLPKVLICSNGVWKFPTDLLDIYIAPIKNVT